MDANLRQAIAAQVTREPLPRLLGIRLVELRTGFAVVEMIYEPAKMDNLFRRAHGGALFALIDEAFETAGQTHGTVAVALNVNVTYVSSPDPGACLRAEAREVSRTKKTASYSIQVKDAEGRLMATCQALAYRTGKPLPFI